MVVNSRGPYRDAGDSWTQRLTSWLTRFLRWFSGHWLMVVNLLMGLQTALPVLAPILMRAGYQRIANLIYFVFRPLCHQLPERSFFLFGDKWVYSYEELSQTLGGLVPQRWLGGPATGFKVAVCQRDVAIYSAIVVGGLLFAGLRGLIRPMPLRGFGLMVLPLAIDGLGQLFGLWTSTWLSRVITGSLFGLACVWLAYPYLEQGMQEVHREAMASLDEWKE